MLLIYFNMMNSGINLRIIRTISYPEWLGIFRITGWVLYSIYLGIKNVLPNTKVAGWRFILGYQ
jgi:hypothetical protein